MLSHGSVRTGPPVPPEKAMSVTAARAPVPSLPGALAAVIHADVAGVLLIAKIPCAALLTPAVIVGEPVPVATVQPVSPLGTIAVVVLVAE